MMERITLSFANRSAALLIGLGCITATLAQTNNIAINNDGAAPAAQAALDISSNYVGPATQKGLLIPRLTLAQRNALGVGLPQGLTIYQTNATPGFYYWEGATSTWVRIANGNSGWGLLGNAGTNPATDFVGTTDAQPLVFRTNATERGRLDIDGDLGVGVVNPQERLDVAGAIRLQGTSTGNAVGTIRWNAGGPYHEGNIDGTPTGWVKMQNDVGEVLSQAYTQPSPVTCANGTAVLGPQTGVSSSALITPYWHPNLNRARHQYLFLANELDLTLNQSLNDPTATQGLCAGQPINSIAFRATGVGLRKTYTQIRVRIKHTSVTSLTGFDNTPDPNAQCYFALGETRPGGGATATPAPNAWDVFDLTGPNGSGPFIWNGVDNLLIEVCYAAASGAAANAEVWTTTGLSFNGSYTAGGSACGAPDNSCGPFVAGCAAASNCGTFGGVNIRPVIQFNGVTASAAPATAGLGDYLYYSGGLIVQQTPTFAASTTPYTFQGPGTITAENGVYASGSQLNDHVFDRYFDGRVRPEDADAFGSQRMLPIDDMVDHLAAERHLPTMKGRDAWDAEGGFSLDDLTGQLWRTTETQALYLVELKERADLLEALATERPIRIEELPRMRAGIAAMQDLSESEKARLIQGLESRTTKPADAR